MDEQIYYALPITLSKAFLLETHGHPLIKERWNEATLVALDKLPQQKELTFGGLYNRQFLTPEEVVSFSKAFDNLLQMKLGDVNLHKDRLLYYMNFFDQGNERQSVEYRKHNELLDYEVFLTALQQTCEVHFASMEKNEDYVKLISPTDISLNDHTDDELKYPSGKRYFFAKKELAEQFSVEELENLGSSEKGEVVRYDLISYGRNVFHVPYELQLSIICPESSESLFTSMPNKGLTIPRNLQSEVLSTMVKHMMKAHEKNNTEFYNNFCKSDVLESRMSKHNASKYHRRRLSVRSNLVRVGTVIQDYLLKYTELRGKTKIAEFLFEYFALFKVFPVNSRNFKKASDLDLVFPKDYSQIAKYYQDIGITSEWVRLMMKEANRYLGEI